MVSNSCFNDDEEEAYWSDQEPFLFPMSPSPSKTNVTCEENDLQIPINFETAHDINESAFLNQQTDTPLLEAPSGKISPRVTHECPSYTSPKNHPEFMTFIYMKKILHTQTAPLASTTLDSFQKQPSHHQEKEHRRRKLSVLKEVAKEMRKHAVNVPYTDLQSHISKLSQQEDLKEYFTEDDIGFDSMTPETLHERVYLTSKA